FLNLLPAFWTASSTTGLPWSTTETSISSFTMCPVSLSTWKATSRRRFGGSGRKGARCRAQGRGPCSDRREIWRGLIAVLAQGRSLELRQRNRVPVGVEHVGNALSPRLVGRARDAITGPAKPRR